MLATKVCEHIKSTRGWCLERPNGVLTVIRDQSRYLSITNPDLQRNLLRTKQEIKLQQQCLKLKKKRRQRSTPASRGFAARCEGAALLHM